MAFAAFDMQLANRQLRVLEKEIGKAEKQVRLGAAIALTKTAKRAQDAIRQEMPKVFDRPTRYTLNATYVKPARAGTKAGSKTDLTASVKIKDAELKNQVVPPVNYLVHQVEGGRRQQKRFEVALQRIGILPAGWLAVPGKGAELDAYGNIKASQIVQILSYFQAFGETGYRANSTEATRAKLKRGGRRRYGRAYFAAIPGRPRSRHLQPGVYLRQYGAFGTALRPVLIFIRKATYSPRLPFYDIARETFDKWIDHELDAAIDFVRQPKPRAN